MKTFFLLFLILFFIPSLFAASLCQNEMTLALSENSIDMSGSSSRKIDLNIFRKYNYKACKYFLTFSKGSSSNFDRKLFLPYPSSTLPLQFYKDTSFQIILMDFPELNSEANAITGNYPNNPTPSPRNHSFYVNMGNIPLGIPSGYYADTFKATLYSGTFSGNYDYSHDQTFTVSYYIPNSVALSIVNTGAPFDEYSTNRILNFGAMATGLVQSFDTVIKANSGYKLFFTSENGGKMKHQNLAATVNYTTQINGSSVNLSQGTPIQVASSNTVTPPDGQRLNVRLTLGTVNTQPAGNYSDFVTVTVQSN